MSPSSRRSAARQAGSLSVASNRAALSLSLFLLLLAVFLAVSTSSAGSVLEALEEELKLQVDEASRSAVTVVAIAEEESTGGIRRNIGCGVVLDSLGHILTTNAVVDGASRIEVYTPERRRVSAEILGGAPFADLALLKAEGTEWTGARLGDSEVLQPGSLITVMGNSYGAGPSVNLGMVSRRRPYRALPGVRLIQMNIGVKPGDTGAMVLNSRGEVVGIVCASLADPRQPTVSESGAPGSGIPGWDQTGIGFAMPISSALVVARRLRAGSLVEHGFLGVEIRDLEAFAGDERSLVSSTGGGSGVQIIQVLAPSPAESAGLQRGDIVLEVNGSTVASALDLSRLVVESSPGTELELLIRRGQETLLRSVTVGRRPRGFPPSQ